MPVPRFLLYFRHSLLTGVLACTVLYFAGQSGLPLLANVFGALCCARHHRSLAALRIKPIFPIPKSPARRRTPSVCSSLARGRQGCLCWMRSAFPPTVALTRSPLRMTIPRNCTAPSTVSALWVQSGIFRHRCRKTDGADLHRHSIGDQRTTRPHFGRMRKNQLHGQNPAAVPRNCRHQPHHEQCPRHHTRGIARP